MSLLIHQRNSTSASSFVQARQASYQKHQYLSLHQATLAPLEPLSSDSETKNENKEKRTITENSSITLKPLLAKSSPMSSLNSSASSNKDPGRSALNSSLSPSTIPKLSNPKYVPSNSISTKMVEPLSRITYGFLQNGNRGKVGGASNAPIIDPDVPNVVRITGANLFNAEVKFVNYPPLPAYGDPEFNSLLKNKLDICSCILDFTNVNFQIQEKEIKARTLCELIELFENNRQISQLDSEQQELIFQMLDKNIFQQDPTFFSPSIAFDKYSNLTISEPCWPHLFYCYQILNRFAQIFSKSPHINIDIARKAIYLTQLPDTNERMQLVAFLRTYFDTHPNDQKQILELVQRKLNAQMNSQMTPFCAMPLIIFLTHIYSRFYANSSTIPPEFKKVFKEGVIPLLGHPDLPLFQQNLKQLILTVLTKHKLLSKKVLRHIEIKWPQTNSQTQLLFFNLITSVFDKMDPREFKGISKRAFIFIADCCESTNYRLQELALDLWKNATMDNWIGLNGRVAVNQMYEPVLKVSEKHWSKVVSEKASAALTEMCRINKREYQKMKSYVNQMRVKRLKPRVPNDTQKGWAAIAKTAAELETNSGRTPDFDLNTKLKEFYDLFHNEKKVTTTASRFMPVLKKHLKEDKDKDKAGEQPDPIESLGMEKKVDELDSYVW